MTPEFVDGGKDQGIKKVCLVNGNLKDYLNFILGKRCQLRFGDGVHNTVKNVLQRFSSDANLVF